MDQNMTASADRIEHAGGKMLGSVQDGVGTIVFNQPEKRNAMSVEMWDGMTAMLDAWRDDPAVRVVVLTGAGDKAFVSGADISQFGQSRSNAEAQKEYDKLTSSGRAKLASFPKPVIARIQGFCLGGGLGIAMQADLRIAADDAQFGIPAAKLGIAYSFAMVSRLTALIGPSDARMLLFTGDRIDAAEALRLKLVNRVVPAAELSATVDKIARDHRRQRPALDDGHEADQQQRAARPGRSRHGSRRSRGADLFRQRRLHGGPDRVHGKAQAELPGEVGQAFRKAPPLACMVCPVR